MKVRRPPVLQLVGEAAQTFRGKADVALQSGPPRCCLRGPRLGDTVVGEGMWGFLRAVLLESCESS